MGRGRLTINVGGSTFRASNSYIPGVRGLSMSQSDNGVKEDDETGQDDHGNGSVLFEVVERSPTLAPHQSCSNFPTIPSLFKRIAPPNSRVIVAGRSPT